MFEKLAHRNELGNVPNRAGGRATIESEMRSVTGGLATISHLSFRYQPISLRTEGSSNQHIL